MTSAIDLPKELCEQPTAFVVLTGLDIKYNAVHKSIWDAFSNNRRSDRVPISFGCLPGDHCYPRCKEKRTSYEWYIPKGILKTQWLDKHLHQVPAVVVIFYELDWDETAWRERQIECASRVEVVRSSLQGRGTKVAVVLIQKSTPLPPGEDMVAAERAAALCSACDLSAKSLFVLPHTDHLLGYIIRLENAFYELANSYYHTEARRVKAHKEFLNKTTHQLLYPRHQFKIGFLHELMQDASTAVKHYRQAYTHIHELRSHHTNNLEIKVIGGYINYKICRLCFLNLNTPLDAISQFRRHIDLFKPKVGNPELSFEHCAWMSKQFTLFGDLFDEAINKGLAAIQTQHPGFYYQQAAYYAQERRKLAVLYCSLSEDDVYPESDPLVGGGDELEFFGQRPWRQGHQSIDPPDVQREKDGILALKHQEAAIDHSWIIIPLLSNAIAQFKKYNCPRMKMFLTIQMGEEYYLARDYSKAAALLTHVTRDYRSHHWKAILTRILSLTLRCAYLIANVQLYLSTCLELLGEYTDISETDKTRIQMNLIRVISGGPPDAETLPEKDNDSVNDDDVESLEQAKQLWVKALTQPKMYNIDMNNLVAFVDCKVRFSAEAFQADKPVCLDIFLRTLGPFPIRFSQLAVSLGRPEYDQYCIVNEMSKSGTNELYFEPSKLKKISFKFPVHPEDVDKIIQVLSVEMRLSSETDASNGNCALLTWHGSCNNASIVVSSQKADVQDAMRCKTVTKWQDILQRMSSKVLRRPSKLNLDVAHFPPALSNEVYPLKINVKSNEKNIAQNVTVIVRLEPGQADDVFHSTFLGLDANTITSHPSTKAIEINFGKMRAEASETKSVFIHSTSIGERSILIQINYNIEDEVVIGENTIKQIHCSCTEEVKVKFETKNALEVKSQLTGLDFKPLSTAEPCGKFVGMVTIKCCSPWPIEIRAARINVNPKHKSYVKLQMDSNVSHCINDINLETDEIAKDAVCFQLSDNFPQSRVYECEIGDYVLEWRRKIKEENSLPFVKTERTFPNVKVKPQPLRAHVSIPTYGELKKQIVLVYTLKNCTNEVQEIEIACGVSENFMYSGIKLKKARILPKSDLVLKYGLFPLSPGFQTLPKINVKMLQQKLTVGKSESDFELCSYLDQALPIDIFIKPSSNFVV